MKKIFLMLVILGVGYIISIFLAPSFADSVGNLFGLKSFNEKLRNNGGDVNRVFTEIPSAEELGKGYNDAIKKAKEFGNDVSDGIDKTKETIDDIRVTLSGAEQKIDEAKETYDNLKKTYEDVNKKIDETKETYNNIKKNLNDIEKVSNVIQNSVNTDIVQ